MKIKKQIEELESFYSHLSKKSFKISSRTVSWQIEHSILSTISVIKSLKESKPKTVKKKFSFAKAFVYTFGIIPRGRGKAPKYVQPNDDTLTKEALNSLIKESLIEIENINEIDQNSWIKHPVFGELNKKDALRFIEIHNHHHIKIIKDIIRSSK